MKITELPHEILSLILSKTFDPYKYAPVCTCFKSPANIASKIKLQKIFHEHAVLTTKYQNLMDDAKDINYRQILSDLHQHEPYLFSKIIEERDENLITFCEANDAGADFLLLSEIKTLSLHEKAKKIRNWLSENKQSLSSSPFIIYDNQTIPFLPIEHRYLSQIDIKHYVVYANQLDPRNYTPFTCSLPLEKGKRQTAYQKYLQTDYQAIYG